MFELKNKLKVGIIGATGMVGQRLITLLDNHPYFDVSVLAASARSAGRTYGEVVGTRRKLSAPMPEYVKTMKIDDAANVKEVSEKADFVFCAVNMDKSEILAMEDSYARAETPVFSCNSANRMTEDVPMLMPEINDSHLDIIEYQKKRLGTKRGFIVTKPNCSIQSYTPLLTPLLDFKPTVVTVTTYQAISGAGKTFREWPEMQDNIIPFIGGEEEKSEQEPLKIWGHIDNGRIVKREAPVISAQCIRVPVSDGHLAAVFVSFEKKPEREEILARWKEFRGKPQILGLPHAPEQFITYMEEDNRPQTRLDRDICGGMGITAGRLRGDNSFDWRFVGLSHNTLRGAAGGAVLGAELLAAEGIITNK